MKKGIVCVDDEKIIIMSLADQLKDYFGDRYVYEMAMSGEEALFVIDEMITDGVTVILVISDWLMHGMMGDELMIKVHQKYPGMLKIMLTGQATPEAIETARECGGLSAFVTKPWDKMALMNKINDLLESI